MKGKTGGPSFLARKPETVGVIGDDKNRPTGE
jgi:hypothetical protein